MANIFTNVTEGVGTMLSSVLAAMQQLPEQQVALWIDKWTTITDKVKEMNLDTEGKTVSEVLTSLAQVLPGYVLLADVTVVAEGYLAEDKTTDLGFTLGFSSSSISLSGSYASSSEKRSAGNVKVQLVASFSETPRVIPYTEIKDLVWSDFTDKLDSFNFLSN